MDRVALAAEPAAAEVENLVAGVTNPTYKSVFAFLILIGILLFRPQGIIGRGETSTEES